jgi:hypothetical protein
LFPVKVPKNIKILDAKIHGKIFVGVIHHDDSGDGTTLLHLACGVGLFDLAVRVLERRADVALEHRYFGAPLLLAAEQGGDHGDPGMGFWELGNVGKLLELFGKWKEVQDNWTIGEHSMFRFAVLGFPMNMGRRNL